MQGTRKLISLVEAIRMVERGDATPEDVDQAMELGAGYRMSFSRPRLSPLPFVASTLFTSCTL